MSRKELIMIISAGILWGSSCLFVEMWKTMGLTAVEMTALRIIAAFVCFLLYVALFKRESLKTRLKDIPLYIGSGITLFTTAAFYYSAMNLTSVSTAVVLMYMAPVLVLAWSVAFFGEKLTVPKIIAVAGVLMGCALVSGIAGGTCFNLKGTAMGLLSGVSYGTYSIFTKVQARKNCNSVTASIYSFLFAAVSVIVVCNFSDIREVAVQYPLKTVLLSVLHGVITFVLPYFLYALSLKKIPAGVAASMAIVEPLSGTLFGVAFLGETLSLAPACGIVLILGAIIVLSRGDG